jgi:hypothetical protein
MITHDDNATTWRELTDQLTPEQIARFEQQESSALAAIAAGRNPHESPESVARCILNDARLEAQGNLDDAMINVAVPEGAETVEHWEDDGAGTWVRFVHGRVRSIPGCAASVYLDGVQTRDGAVVWKLFVHVEDRDDLTVDQVRTLSAALSAAAYDLDRIQK